MGGLNGARSDNGRVGRGRGSYQPAIGTCDDCAEPYDLSAADDHCPECGRCSACCNGVNKARAAGHPSHYPSKAEKRDRTREIEDRKAKQLAAAQAAAKERGDHWTPRRWEDLKSGRQRDAEMTLARTNARARNKRGNATHETTTRLATQHDVVVIENLHVKGMMQFGHLGRSIADVCPGEFRRQLVYKGRGRAPRSSSPQPISPPPRSAPAAAMSARGQRSYHCARGRTRALGAVLL